MNSGQILKQFMNDNGKKQKWLADKMNIPLSTMSNLLNREISFSKLIKICELLELSIYDFYKIYKEKNAL